jgi:multidrug efflux pump subunit AcrB
MDGRTGLLGYFVRHRTAANLFMLLMLLAGALVAPQMRTQFFPDVVVDNVTVTVAWPGAGASDVDAAIMQVVEPALMAVTGVTATSARATEGSARFTLEFEPGHDMDRAERDVTSAIAALSDLPADAADPAIRRSTWSDRVTDIVIAGPVGVDQLARFADELAARLFAAGVTQVTVQGVAAPLTVVEVPSLRLVTHDIGLSDIADAIARETATDPAGEIDGTARLRTGTDRRTPEEIGAIVLRQEADGTTLTVADVATIRVEGVDRDRAFFAGADPAVKIGVQRTAQGDAIGLQETVEEIVAEVQAGLPDGVTITLVNAQAEQISGRLALLLDNGAMGLALVVVLLFLFLNARTALWVAAGIPVAMFAGLALMQAFGLTLNMISLFALILMLGIVVDDAIVVGEHVDFRRRVLGETPEVAAAHAARRMFWPVTAAAMTTIIAFGGLISIGGTFGDLIEDIPVTVILILIASLAECFLILPHHLGHGAALARERWYDWPSRMVNRAMTWFSQAVFRPLMRLVILARYPVVAGAVLILAAQMALLVRGDVQWRFFSPPESATVTGNFAMLPTATREDSLAMMNEMQRAADAVADRLAEGGPDPVVFILAEIGGNAGRPLQGADQKEPFQLGAISIQLVDPDARAFTAGEFTQALQEEIRQHPLAETVSFRSFGRGPGGDAIDIQLAGLDSATLKAAAEDLKARLARFPEVTGLEDSLSYDKEEYVLSLTPQGQALGLAIDDLGRVLRDHLAGIEAASFPSGTRSAAIRVELPPGELTADFLTRMMVRAPAGAHVALADVVTVDRQSGFSTIRRENGIMLISVTGGLEDEDAARAAEVMASIAGDALPAIEERHGVEATTAGLSAQEDEFLAEARTGFILCLAGIFLVLAWVFGSWTRPLVVMSVIPFGLVGAIWGHWAWDLPMSLFTVVGLIGMTGIIINDSIVLVSTVDEYAEKRGLFPAIVDAAADRLRPIFLTTATTVLGLAPLMFEGSSQALFLQPTVVTLVFGLGFGMFIVLLLVPAVLAIQADVGRHSRAARRAIATRQPGAIAGAAGLALLFCVLILPVILSGAPLGPLVVLMPPLAAGFWPAFGLMTVAGSLWLCAIYAMAVLRRAT